MPANTPAQMLAQVIAYLKTVKRRAADSATAQTLKRETAERETIARTCDDLVRELEAVEIAPLPVAVPADRNHEWQLQCYGCTEAEARHGIDELAAFCGFGRTVNANMALGSILSDVQELIERGRSNEARQYINRVKCAIFNAAPMTLWQQKP